MAETTQDRHWIRRTGLVYVKVPRTGSESFIQSWRRTFGDGLLGPGHQPRVFDQRRLLECHATFLRTLPPAEQPPGDRPNIVKVVASFKFASTELESNGGESFVGKYLGGHKVEFWCAHWPPRYAPEVYRQLMVSPTPVVITILRSPPDRAISEYFFRLKLGLRPGVTPGLPDFDDYISTTKTLNYSDYFSGGAGDDAARVAAACRTIESKLDFVGLTERYDDLIAALNLRFSTNLKQVHINEIRKVLPGVPQFTLDDLPAPTLKKLLQKTESDREIYEVAKSRFAREFEALRHRLQ